MVISLTVHSLYSVQVRILISKDGRSLEECRPVGHIEPNEKEWDDHGTERLKDAGRSLVPMAKETDDDDEVDDHNEHKDNAHEHPDVQERDVGDAGNVGANRPEHGS